jgi:hypothetical protein
MSKILDIVRPLAVGIGIFGAAGAIGSAQMTNPCPAPDAASTADGTAYTNFDTAYNSINSWQSAWDNGNYDRNHIVIGTVGSFAPYRLSVLTAKGDSMTIDLKNGTIIRPDGTTPASGQHVAVFGYWSNGTFIANRVILRG